MDNGTWDNANQSTMDNSDLTTDDLVIMIGEGVVNQRHRDKIISVLKEHLAAAQRQIQDLAAQVSGKISDISGKDNEIAELSRQLEQVRNDNNSMQTRILELENQAHDTANLIQQLEQSRKNNNSLQTRILELENQVHDTALQRDEAMKKLDAVTASAKKSCSKKVI